MENVFPGPNGNGFISWYPIAVTSNYIWESKAFILSRKRQPETADGKNGENLHRFVRKRKMCHKNVFHQIHAANEFNIEILFHFIILLKLRRSTFLQPWKLMIVPRQNVRIMAALSRKNALRYFFRRLFPFLFTDGERCIHYDCLRFGRFLFRNFSPSSAPLSSSVFLLQIQTHFSAPRWKANLSRFRYHKIPFCDESKTVRA